MAYSIFAAIGVLILSILAFALIRSKANNESSMSILDVEDDYCVMAVDLFGFTNGLPLSDAHRILGAKWRHQFTIQAGTSVVTCAALLVDRPYFRYYLIFTDDALQGFVIPPQREVSLVDYNGVKLEVEDSLDVESMVEKTMRSKLLRISDVIEHVKHQKMARSGEGGGFGMPIRLIRSQAGDLLKQYEENNSLRKKYDAYQISIGESRLEVQNRLGTPSLKIDADQSYYSTDIFKIQSPKDINPLFRLSGIAVNFKNDIVVSVYAGDFFSESK